MLQAVARNEPVAVVTADGSLYLGLALLDPSWGETESLRMVPLFRGHVDENGHYVWTRERLQESPDPALLLLWNTVSARLARNPGRLDLV